MFDEICRRHALKPKQVEQDLQDLLRGISERKTSRVFEFAYRTELESLLHQDGYILRGRRSEITQKGKAALKRKWIYYNAKEVNKRRLKSFLVWFIPVLIALLSLLDWNSLFV